MSETAKSGFITEDQVVNEFENWQTSLHAMTWLSRITKEKINTVTAKTTRSIGRNSKADVIVTINGKDSGISIKKFTANFNQIDKRWIDNYVKLWDIPQDVGDTLRKYCGVSGFRPMDHGITSRDTRRYFLDEVTDNERDNLVGFFQKNNVRIINDVLCGADSLHADFLLVIRKDGNNIAESHMAIMENVLKHYNGDVTITKRGNLKMGKITIQRKGGNGGGPTAQMLQFKFSPKGAFEL